MKKHKGVFEQIGDTNKYDDLTEDKIKEILEDLIQVEEEDDNTIVIQRYCMTNGTILSTPMKLNLCNNPNCASCNDIEEAIKEQARAKEDG